MPDTTLQIECLQANAVGTPKLYLYDPTSLAAVGSGSGYGITSSVSLLCRFVIPELDAVTGTVYGEVRDDEKVLAFGWATAAAGQTKHLGPSLASETTSLSSADLATIEGYTTTARDAVIARGDAAWITATGFSTLDAAGVRAAVGLASANLDTQLAAIVEDTGTTIPGMFPASFAALGINASGHLLRVVLVDTTTSNTDMRGTDGASTLTAADIDARLAAYDGPTHAELTAAFTEIKGATWSSLTDTLEAIRDRGDAAWVTATGFATPTNVTDAQTAIITRGDAAWITATGFSTHSAADVWTVASRTLTAFGFSVTVGTNNDKTGYSIGGTISTLDALNTQLSTDHGAGSWTTATGFSTVSADEVASAVWNAAIASYGTVGSYGELLEANLDAAISSRGTSTLTMADIDARLAAYDGPTHAELTAAFTEIKGATWNATTDTLEAIRDRGDAAWLTASGFATPANVIDTQTAIITRGDAAWTTATGFSTHSAADVWTAASRTLTAFAFGVTVDTNNDKAGYSISGTLGTLDALNTQLATDHGAGSWTTATGFSTVSADEVASAVWNAAVASYGIAGSYGELLETRLDAAISSRGTSTLTAADIDARLAAYDSPTHAELTAAFTEIKGATWNATTDTLESIRDRGDAAWVTAVGFATPGNVTDAQNAIIARGDAAWITATGFAVPGDVLLLDMTQATPGVSTVGAQLDAAGTGGLTAAETSQLLAVYQLTAASGGTGTLNGSATGDIASDVRTVLDGAHGAGSWEGGVGAAGGGPVPLTVTVETTSGDPLSGVTIYMLDAAGNPLEKWLPTDSGGRCVFGLPAGDYQVAVATLTGYATPAPVPKTLLAGTAASQTIVLTRQTTEAPSSGSLCLIDDFILDAGQRPVAGAVITARASEDAVLLNPGVLTQVKARAISGADGRFQLQLVRGDAFSAGAAYTIEIKHDAKGIFRQIIGPVPSAATALLKDIEAGA